ncbi:MAG: ABC transporter ATP-binding protein [Erysipelotrichaceae bacterium]|nr:ABC transporter ATP-binding protein [Erysipelotrichaceae bacterium]
MKDSKRLFYYLAKIKWELIFGLIMAIIFVSADVLIPLIIGKIIDVVSFYINHSIDPISYPNIFDFNLIPMYLSIISGLVVVVVILSYFFDTIISISIERIGKEIKNDVYKKINYVSVSYIDTHTHGDLISRIINDTDLVIVGLVGSFKQFYQGIITILITIGFMFYLNWVLGLIILILTPFSFLVSFFIAKNINKHFKIQAKEQGNLSGIFLEDINNIDVLKSFNYEDKEFDKFSIQNDKLTKITCKSQFFSSLTNPSARLINSFTYAAVCFCGAILCAYSFKNQGVLLGATFTIGTLSTFLQYANKFAKPFNEMSSVVGEIQQGITSFRRINEILSTENDVDNGEEILKSPVKSIYFNHIYFSYKKNKPLIEDFNLEVKEGQKVAIVGPTGCGKTTMINLLMRFYDPNEGSFDFNSINSLIIKKSSLRRHFGMVLQDTWLFKGTIFDNIAYGKKDATNEDVYEAARQANAYNFIMRLQNGFNTIVNDDCGLSAGQKQLITIARVILLNPEIMILDEATSNVDTHSEHKLIKAFDEMMKNKTSFVIAHRLSTIVNSDLIIVMKNGHIVETGKHDELLARNGFYSELFNAQFDKVNIR